MSNNEHCLVQEQHYVCTVDKLNICKSYLHCGVPDSSNRITDGTFMKQTVVQDYR